MMVDALLTATVVNFGVLLVAKALRFSKKLRWVEEVLHAPIANEDDTL